jgi:hypothetical protein
VEGDGLLRVPISGSDCRPQLDEKENNY